MCNRTKKLAKKAGFIFWSEEENPAEPIDWSCDYDQELQKFEEIVRKDERKKLLKSISTMLDTMHIAANGRHNYWLVAKNLINTELEDN